MQSSTSNTPSQPGDSNSSSVSLRAVSDANSTVDEYEIGYQLGLILGLPEEDPEEG
jgi:hypothetical protein